MNNNNSIFEKNKISLEKETTKKFSTFPAANISESKTHYQIILEVPGFSHEDITVQSVESKLYVSGDHTENPTDKTRMQLSKERHTAFRWSYDLKMPLTRRHLMITLENGFLFITVQKNERGFRDVTEKFVMENYLEDNIYFPRANVVETPNHMEMSLEIPGYKNEDVSIKIVDSSLTISGKRSTILLRKEENYLKIEIPFSNSFLRRFELPDNINQRQVSWNVQHGVLYVYMPKLKSIRLEEVAKESMLS